MIGLYSDAPGADAIYTASAAAGTSAIRMVTREDGDGAIGLYLLNGFDEASGALSANDHKGIFLKDFNDGSGSGQFGIHMTRIGNAPMLRIDNADAGASASQTADFFQIVAERQASGSLVNLFQTTTAFSGTMFRANAGNNSGTFTGDFARFDIAGAAVFKVPASGSAYSAGHGRFGSTAAPANTAAGDLTIGRLSIGNQNLAGFIARIDANLSGDINSYAWWLSPTIQSDVTGSASVYVSIPSTQAAAFSLTTLNHFRAAQGSFGAGSSVAEQNGFVVANSLIGATSNFGFRGKLAAASGVWNLYFDGDANVGIAGKSRFGGTSVPTEAVDVTGNILASGKITWSPGTSVTPASNGQVTVEFTNNTTLTFKGKGSDGTVRSATLTLA